MGHACFLEDACALSCVDSSAPQSLSASLSFSQPRPLSPSYHLALLNIIDTLTMMHPSVRTSFWTRGPRGTLTSTRSLSWMGSPMQWYVLLSILSLHIPRFCSPSLFVIGRILRNGPTTVVLRTGMVLLFSRVFGHMSGSNYFAVEESTMERESE